MDGELHTSRETQDSSAEAAAHQDDNTLDIGSRALASEAEWRRVLGTPATAERVLRPDVDEADPETIEYGGGQSFDLVYRTPLLDCVFESRNVGRHDGHMANLVVTRNETGLPWIDGWSQGDEALDNLMSQMMDDLDHTLPRSRPVPAQPSAGELASPVEGGST